MAEGYVQHQKKQADKIIRITEKLYMERGMEGFTIGDIADGAEITRATVYNYFSCKEDILWAIFFEKMDGLLLRLNKKLEDTTTTFERLQAFAEANYEYFKEDASFAIFFDLFHTIFATASQKPDDFWESPYNISNWRPGKSIKMFTENFHDGSVKANLDPHATVVSYYYAFLGTMSFTFKNKDELTKFYGLDYLDVAKIQISWILQAIKAD